MVVLWHCAFLCGMQRCSVQMIIVLRAVYTTTRVVLVRCLLLWSSSLFSILQLNVSGRYLLTMMCCMTHMLDDTVCQKSPPTLTVVCVQQVRCFPVCQGSLAHHIFCWCCLGACVWAKSLHIATAQQYMVNLQLVAAESKSGLFKMALTINKRGW